MLLTILSIISPISLAICSILVGMQVGARQGFYEGYRLGHLEGSRKAKASMKEVKEVLRKSDK